MSGGNTSSAVMQRRNPALDKFDDFPTPMWATRAVLEWLARAGHDLSGAVVREPCANRGYMAVPLAEVCAAVEASDVLDYGVGYPVRDYLFGEVPEVVDWTFMNPPFVLAQQFIERALMSSRGVAVFCRSAFVEGAQRHAELFSVYPPAHILQFTERVVLHKSAMRRAGDKWFDPDADDGAGRWKSASSATAYCWMIWLPGTEVTTFDWIAPCRLRLERPGDYEVRGNV
ncbi:hypothetical protein EU805_01705 [Salipiger sp. IMCC34102]|uniref:hypothetical protein n=1 Tax=Salipiger sp. IMCC34102 TaxID=2510647 RepID=UPI00101D8E7F|nr:hypothetical protein [Salipiger sp. IMCC34102]RYH04113.1 hypothetical protein EU805_01705 [Salipiger sp. IMCC34102]